jgi:hypothetical protein
VLTPRQGALICDEDFLRLAHRRGLPFAEAERLHKAMKHGDQGGTMVTPYARRHS